MRDGFIYRRCGVGHRYTKNTQQCPKCGLGSFSWGYVGMTTPFGPTVLI